ncbi:hypothetical protein [Amycolatopsis anabasis]|uniref:hypothetical protein n=1 Tax=Amycolatopsis anabasis TaxID=1840409 RepID=UPI00131BA818|nr:hypothetical protein [Amycolatopsis anabasis]
MEPDRKVVVSVAEDRHGALADVVTALRAAGMNVDHVLEPIGTVTGSLGSSTVNALRSVPGVAEVELAREYQLPPEGEPQ